MTTEGVVTVQATMRLRVIRDDNVLGAFSGDFRLPDRLQQAWLGDDGSITWRDVEVIKASTLDAAPRGEGEQK